MNGTASKTATKVKDKLRGMRGDAALYRLNPPLGRNEYVVVSAVVAYSGPETYIFPADETGEITSWIEMDGSFRGALDHEQALRNSGYEAVR